MKEILPGIYQITLPLPGFSPDSMNVYLFRHNQEYLIIDTGCDTPALVDFIKELLVDFNIRFSDIKQVLITHCHVDHLGMIGRYKKENNAKIYLHQNETGLIKIRFSHGDNYWPMTEQFLQGQGMPATELTPTQFQLPGVTSLPAPDVLFQGGEEIPAGQYKLRVINTPGHTPGHVAYYEPEKKLLFCGDVLLPTIVTNAALHVQHITNPIQQYLHSLEILKKLDVELVLPGHEYIFSGHRQRIDEIVQHIRNKNQEIIRSFTDNVPRTAYAISRLLSWSPNTKVTTWFKLSDWDKRFAVLQTTAHLEELVYAKKLARFSQNDIIYYQKP